MVKFGISGCGDFVETAILPMMQRVGDIQVVAAFDINADRLAAVCKKFGIREAYSTYNGLLDSDADVIGYICECDAANIDGLDPVNFGDFSVLAADWLLSAAELPGDINRDETVDLRDMQQVAQHWLADCAQ